jgi:hypothetical protein
VVDDCDPESPCPPASVLLRPEPRWRPGQRTLARNLLSAIPHIQHDKVVFLEDDDWIAPEYLTMMEERLDHNALVGEKDAHYYNVSARRYRLMGNRQHSSLAQIGIQKSSLPVLKRLCQANSAFLDLELCRMIQDKNIYPRSGLHVALKGLPGRPGIGVGHQRSTSIDWSPDPDLSILRSWIGNSADNYAPFHQESE